MKYNFDRIVSRAGTHCFKYDNREEVFGCGNVIPLWIADMDFPVAPFIEQAMRRRMELPVYGYEKRSPAFYRSVTEWVRRRNNWSIDPAWIDFTPGCVAGFAFGIRALTSPGDKVVIQPPVYPPFAATIKANDRELVTNPLTLTEEGYRIDFEDLDRKLQGAKMLLFCNPHNPTGRVYTREELLKVGELCIKHNVNIVSDEIHSDLIQKPYHHIHIASLSPELAERTITLIAPSKTFNLAGLSTALAVTPGDTLRRRLRCELDKTHVDQGNVFGNAALEAAYREGEEWLEQLLEYIGGNMDFIVEYIGKHMHQIKARRSEGTYMMWLDMRGLEMCHSELAEFLVRKAGLGFNDGALFGKEGECFMRINLATSREVLHKAMDQLRDAVEKR